MYVRMGKVKMEGKKYNRKEYGGGGGFIYVYLGSYTHSKVKWYGMGQ